MSAESGITCGGNAKPDDTHLAVTIVAIDADIIRVLEQRQRRRSKKRTVAATVITEPACKP
jgi:hypothetical protein